MAIASTRATFEAYKRAAEAKDDHALAMLYADDAEILDVNHRTPPGSPERVRGRQAIESRFGTVPRELVHEVSDPVLADDQMAFTYACRYPTGQRVFGIHICKLRDGKIAREVVAEAWDE